MENASDALYMAVAVLIFVSALTICISSFSIQTSQIDQIVTADERIDTAIDEDGKFVNYISHSESQRTVGVETIVNSLYRTYKENYTVYIKLKSDNYSGLDNSIDKGLKIQEAGKEQNYNGTTIINESDDIIVIKISTEYSLQNAKEKLNEILDSGLYTKLKDLKFTEYIGEVYQNDINTSGDLTATMPADISDANKTKVRIITYVQQ